MTAVKKMAAKKKQTTKRVGWGKVEVDEEQVFKLAQFGCNDGEIASFFGVDRMTLVRHFEQVIAKGHDNLRRVIRKKQVELAMHGDRTMLIWLGKQMLGQKEPSPLIAIQNNYTENDGPTTSINEIVEGWETQTRKALGLPEPAEVSDKVPGEVGTGQDEV